MRTCAVFGVKYFGFFKIYGVSTRTKGRRVEPEWTFCEQGVGGEEVNFSRFCVDVLYGRPLRKLP